MLQNPLLGRRFRRLYAIVFSSALLTAALVAGPAGPAHAGGVSLELGQISGVSHRHGPGCSHWGQLSDQDRRDYWQELISRDGVPRGSAAVRDDDDDDDDDRPRGPGRGGGGPQTVFLDFDSGEPTFDVLIDNGDGTFGVFGTFDNHVYTAEERSAIKQRFQADYAAFDVEFTTEQPAEGEFTTLFFNDNADPTSGPGVVLTPAPGGGFFINIGFGLAEDIDFRNLNRSDNAGVDANFWEFLIQSGNGGLFEAFTGLPATPDGLRTAILNQSANTGAHELGHILGLRHHDAFGPPGSGLPTTGVPAPEAFFPVYEGPQDADETTLHLMASGASSGLSLAQSANADRFFGEREAIKLAFNERGRVIRERRDDDDDDYDDYDDDDGDEALIDSAQEVEMRRLDVPNTVLEGDNADRRLKVEAIAIEGRLEEVGELDLYEFEGEEGDLFTFEVISLVGDRFTDFILGALSIFQEVDDQLVEIAFNDDNFEPFDPLILDFVLPFSGDFLVGVFAPEFVRFDLDGDGVAFDPVPDALRIGDYELFGYKFDTRRGRRSRGSDRIAGPSGSAADDSRFLADGTDVGILQIAAPAPLWLLGLGVAALGVAQRRRRWPSSH